MINDTLFDFDNEVNESLKLFFDSKKLPLYDMMSYHFGLHDKESATTKRKYSQIIKAFYEIFSTDKKSIIPAAMSLEMVNAFLEIHDDIESGNPQRGSGDAVWWVWGPAQAINAGDAMHSLARVNLYDLTNSKFSKQTISNCIEWLDYACLKSLEGRFRDLEMQEGLNTSVDEYKAMSRDKSGSMIGLCLAIGASLSELNQNQQKTLFDAGQLLGIANQINSDINQLWSDNESQPIDFLNKKKLFPILAAIEKAAPKQKRLLGEVYFKRVLEKEDLQSVREIISDLGTKEESESIVLEFETDAYNKIYNATKSQDFINFLRGTLRE